MDKKIYLITLTENVKYNDIVTGRTHTKVLLLGTIERLVSCKKRTFMTDFIIGWRCGGIMRKVVLLKKSLRLLKD